MRRLRSNSAASINILSQYDLQIMIHYRYCTVGTTVTATCDSALHPPHWLSMWSEDADLAPESDLTITRPCGAPNPCEGFWKRFVPGRGLAGPQATGERYQFGLRYRLVILFLSPPYDQLRAWVKILSMGSARV